MSELGGSIKSAIGEQRPAPFAVPTLGRRLKAWLCERGPEVVVMGSTLEISATYIPFMHGKYLVDGRTLSVIDAGEVSMVIFVVFGFFVLSRKGVRSLGRLGAGVLIFLMYAVVVTALQRPVLGAMDLFRLVLLGAFAVGSMALRSGHASSELLGRCFRRLILWAVGLSIVAILQIMVGFHLWNSDLGQRSNATLADPNHLARFLVVAIALLPAARIRHVWLTFLILASGVASTGSRAGVLILGVVAVFGYMTTSGKSRRLYVGMLIGSALMVAFYVERFFRLVANLGAGSAGRTVLIEEGFKSWLRSPVVGCGTGCFPEALSEEAGVALDRFHEGLRASHTSVVTILVELGAVGLFLVGIFLLRPGASKTIRNMYPGLAAAGLVIFLGSLMEGRLLQDMTFWYLLSLAVAVSATDRKQQCTSGKSRKGLVT
jgi:hypothetical protein